MADGPLVAHLFAQAEARAAAPALIREERVVTYADLRQQVVAAAAWLSRQGVRPGDRVILAAIKSPTFVAGYFATHLVGAIAVPVDPQLPAPALAVLCDTVAPRLVLTGNEPPATHPLETLEQLPAAPMTTRPPALEATADILFTTGTTEVPKGVMLTHRNLAAAARNINTVIGNGPEDVEVLPLPLHHSFGLGRLRCALLAGGAVVFVEGFAHLGPLFRALTRWRATGFCAVPAGLAILFRLTGDTLGDYAQQLRYLEIGSAPMPLEQKHRLMRLLPKTQLWMHYGLTEASRSTFLEFHADAKHLDSIGRPTPNVEIAIVDGQIAIRGETVMQGYWRNPALTAQVLIKGWFRTGDLGSIDAEGFCYLQGRHSDLINIGGRKVAPWEIEEVLQQHPAVAHCACLGIPDPQGLAGEVVKACLVIRDGSSTRPSDRELIEFLRSRLEPSKIPAVFEWRTALPLTEAGKLQRQMLRHPEEPVRR